MSYQTHNLVDGDVFVSYSDLDVDYDIMLPRHLFEVIDVEHSAYMAPDYRWYSGLLDPKGRNMHLVARCVACGEVMNAVVNKNISLCMLEEGDLEQPHYREWSECR